MTFAAVIALFSNIWVRRITLALAILAAFLIYRQHLINEGKDKGVQIGHSDAAQVEQQSLSQQQQMVDAVKKELLPQIQDAQAKASKAEIASGLKDEVIRSLVNQRLQASQGVQQMTETQIAALIAKYTPRDLADCVATRPALLDQVKTQDGKINDMATDLAETKRANLATVELYNDEVGLRTRYQQEYTALYNFQVPKHRGLKCAFLWHCSRKLLPFPSPEQIKLLPLK